MRSRMCGNDRVVVPGERSGNGIPGPTLWIASWRNALEVGSIFRHGATDNDYVDTGRLQLLQLRQRHCRSEMLRHCVLVFRSRTAASLHEFSTDIEAFPQV